MTRPSAHTAEYSPYDVQELTTLADMVAVYPLIRQLNADLTIDAYESMLPAMRQNGYRQVGVFTAGRCIGLSGFWVNTKLYCGRYIEMDNVIVDVTHRSTGVGKILTDWIVQQGRAEGCRVALLDVYVENTNAQRFYFREGFSAVGLHLQRSLQSE